MAEAKAIDPADGSAHKASLAATSLAALGVVFGDIGTSPLYTLKTMIELSGGKVDHNIILGILSLIFWALTIVTTLKYVTVAMRIDNDGEGGILALMALLGMKRANRPWIVAAGLFGAALIYGDGAITPAISVLSALEGLEIATPAVKPYILPATVIVLLGLFLIQPFGTARIGRAFGPLMLVWFAVIALLGLVGIREYPAVLAAVNPLYGLNYLANSGLTGFLVLGGVFLCVTGAEALYADMGHFGASPIRLSWFWIVFPALILSYAGQGAFLLAHGASDDNIFYRLCPPALLIPLVLLATLATIIASQAIITGAFSMTRQAIQLGWMPRLHIDQTSQEGYGQIYVGAVNWLLMIVTVALVLWFQKSDNIAAAYGIAVSTTMLMTTVLLFIAMREVWGWSLQLASLVAGAFMIVDLAFFGANAMKFVEGGYVPILLGFAVYAIMSIWHRGISALREKVQAETIPIDAFLAGLPARGILRVPGTAVFLTRSVQGAPPVVDWYARHANALQEKVVAITVLTEQRPWVDDDKRATMMEIGPNFWRVTARYGFLERPDVTHVLELVRSQGCNADLDKATYFIGLESIGRREDGKGLPGWVVAIFATLQRNAAHVSDSFNFPSDRLIEIGRKVEL